MFSVRQLSQQIAALNPNQFGAFEDWFRAESRDAHSDEQDQIVFAIEDVLSRYHYEQLRGEALRQELENAIRPFVSMIYLSAGDMIEIELPSDKKSFEVDVRVRSLAKSAARSSHLVFAQVA